MSSSHDLSEMLQPSAVGTAGVEDGEELVLFEGKEGKEENASVWACGIVSRYFFFFCDA